MFRELVPRSSRFVINVGKKLRMVETDAHAAAPNHISEERPVAVEIPERVVLQFAQRVADDRANGNLDALQLPHDQEA